MHAGNEPADRNRVDALGVQLHPLLIRLVDPHPEAEFRQKFGFPSARFVTGSGIGINHIDFAALECFHAGETEVVGIGDFLDELARLFAILLFFLQPLPAVVLRFVLALIDQLLDPFFFLGGIFARQRLVVFCDQALDLLSVQLHHIMGL